MCVFFHTRVGFFRTRVGFSTHVLDFPHICGIFNTRVGFSRCLQTIHTMSKKPLRLDIYHTCHAFSEYIEHSHIQGGPLFLPPPKKTESQTWREFLDSVFFLHPMVGFFWGVARIAVHLVYSTYIRLILVLE